MQRLKLKKKCFKNIDYAVQAYKLQQRKFLDKTASNPYKTSVKE